MSDAWHEIPIIIRPAKDGTGTYKLLTDDDAQRVLARGGLHG